MAIDQALRGQKWPTERSLAGELEVNSRTVRRDLKYMRDQLRAPIKFNRGRRGYWYTEATYQLPFLRLTEGELVALFLAEQMFAPVPRHAIRPRPCPRLRQAHKLAD